MIRKLLLALILVTGMAPSLANAKITSEEWSAYTDRFVSQEGRVIDDGNGGISHSEGQGYGLLLAYLAGNRADFERIWSFTERELLLRDDNLAAWKWEPWATPHITDLNNAADGDILIAYALALAGAAWHDQRFTRNARNIARALGRTSVFEHQGELLLLPGVGGFGPKARRDGPVVNPSYWVFEAFPVLARIAPRNGLDEAFRKRQAADPQDADRRAQASGRVGLAGECAEERERLSGDVRLQRHPHSALSDACSGKRCRAAPPAARWHDRP